jgi:peptide/nickel transport system substrate-binding protein
VNYSQFLNQLYTYNKTTLGNLFAPPIPPGWGPLDNLDNIPLYSYNIALGTQLVAQAGQQGEWYVTLPNGTKVGDTSGNSLPPIEYAYILPLTDVTSTIISIIQGGLTQIGVSISPTGITLAQYIGGLTQPQSTPAITQGGWCADFPDPIYQQFFEMGTTIASQASWVNNGTLNALLSKIPFETNSTLQLEQTEQAYQVFNELATMIQMPNSAVYFVHQPNMQNLVYSPFQAALLYNMITYNNTAKTATTTSFSSSWSSWSSSSESTSISVTATSSSSSSSVRTTPSSATSSSSSAVHTTPSSVSTTQSSSSITSSDSSLTKLSSSISSSKSSTLTPIPTIDFALVGTAAVVIVGSGLAFFLRRRNSVA